MMNMNFPSIGNAFVNGEGSSIGNVANERQPLPYENVMQHTLPDDVLATSHRGALHTVLQSKEELREFLITHPICRVFYQSSSPLGYYKKYRHLYHDRVCVTCATDPQFISEFIQISPRQLMNRIVGFELANKGSWTILFMLIMNKQHSLLPKNPTIISTHSDFR